MNKTCPVCTSSSVIKSSASHSCTQCNAALSYNSLPKAYLISLIILVVISISLPLLLPSSVLLHQWLYTGVGLLFLLDTIFFLKSWNLYKTDSA